MSRRKGYSLTEAIIYTLVLSIIILVFANLFSSIFKTSTDSEIQVRALEENIKAQIEECLINTNKILVASTTEVIFISDLNTSPTFDDNADFDSDNISNIIDPDVDNDANLIVPPTDQWRRGYNLKDDDDDNDGKIDIRWKLYILNGELKSDYSLNEEPWGNHIKTICKNIMSSTTYFYYHGSKETLLSDTGYAIDYNSDGIIASDEMDRSGNNNGQLDLESEKNYIVTAGYGFFIDINKDNKQDYKIFGEIMPPLLYLKRKP